MGIIKKDKISTKDTVIKPTIDTIDILAEESTTEIMLDANECEKIFNEFREKGFNEGRQQGYQEGYKEGIITFGKEKSKLEAQLNDIKIKIETLIKTNSTLYMEAMQHDMSSILKETFDTVFSGAIRDETIFTCYLKNIIEYIKKNYDEYSIECSFVTKDILLSLDVNPKTIKVVDNKEDYIITVALKEENIYYNLNEVKERIISIFEKMY